MKPFTSPESPFISPNTQVSRSDTRRYHTADQAGKILSVDNGSGSGAAGTSGDIPTPPTVEELLHMSAVELTQHGYIRTGDGILSIRENERRIDLQRQRKEAQLRREEIISELEEQANKNLAFLNDPQNVRDLIEGIFAGQSSPLNRDNEIIQTKYEIYDLSDLRGMDCGRSVDIYCTLASGDKLFISLGKEGLEVLADLTGGLDEIMAYLRELEVSTVHYTMKLESSDQQYLKDFGELEAPSVDFDMNGFTDEDDGISYQYYEIRAEGTLVYAKENDPSFPNRTNCQREVQEFIDRLKEFEDEEDEDRES